VEVVERKHTQTAGTFESKGEFGFVDSDNQRLIHDVFVRKEAFNGAKSGDKVVVSIDRFDEDKASPEGRILKVIGPANAPGTEVESLAISQGTKVDFPPDVLEEADEIDVSIPSAEIDRRRDLRDERIFTIDPDDAEDFDDAIHLKELSNGNYELGVHIADVSHYVDPDSTMDEEALERATSVYLVDRVIPMLPEKLSNKVCSLRPHEDKLAYSCIMEVTPEGKVVDHDITETVIRSQHRFTYDEAQALIDGQNREHFLADDVQRARRLAKTLTRNRYNEGSVDFDTPEVQVILDDEGRPINIKRKDRTAANRLIEEFMLLANRTVSGHIAKDPQGARPFVYRIHDRPDAEKIQALADYVKAFGYNLPLKGGNVDSKDLNAFLQRIKDKPEAPVIEQAALRSMAKAVYSTNNIGHYGLGFRYYSHFTSPIRRYPDLIVHRLLKKYNAGGSGTDSGELAEQCKHCSEREKAAEQAERESVKLKQVEYMLDHIGERFEGVVSGVTNFGAFVEISELLVEGLVHVSNMADDYYQYDEETYQLVGEDNQRKIQVGDTVEVVVTEVDIETRKVDLRFARG
jgi:ribonuclease R